MMNRGDKLAHYTIESMLGSGGMGAVYLAVDSRLHRRVALKVMLDSDKPEDVKESAARLLREARAAASLTHPNVVGVFDVGEIDGRVFLAMEYVVGKTLRELMRDDSIPWQRRLRWLVETARALAHAHREGLVHRDIKPENVMVRDDGLVKVLDFGIARRTAAPVDPTGRTEQAYVGTLTGKGLVVGTPMYMAPEQLKGGDPDTRTDQFAWGVMSYEVLCGERPWPEKSDLLASVATILTEDPKSIRKHAPELPPAVESTVARTLARNPEDRFETMEDVAELLDPLAVRSGPTMESSRATARARASAPRISNKELPKDEDDPKILALGGEHKSTKQVMVTAKSPEHPLAPAPQPKPAGIFSGRKRWAYIAGVLTAALASGVYYRVFRKVPIVPGPIATASSSLPPIVTPPPIVITENADALAAYQEGIQQWRDGSAHRSHASLERAAQLDPGFASAQLELALQNLVEREGSRAQERYHRAYSHRDRLAPRDADVLAALDPLVRATEDLSTAEQRLTASASKMKKEPVFEYLLGYVHEMQSNYEQARSDYERAFARDPGYMPALLAKGHVFLQLGNADAALDTYGKCIRASSAAAICLEQRLLLLRDRGECESMEQDARAWQTVEPEAPDPSYWVAAALMARGAPIQSVEVALRHEWDLQPKDDRATNEAEDTANLALAQGDFAAAERATKDWDAALTQPEVNLHSGPQQQLAFIAYEADDKQKAASIADNFMKVVPAYTPASIGDDPTIWAAEYLYRAARINKDELEKRRKDWFQGREAGRTQQDNLRLAPFRWALVYGGFAETLDEARDALSKMEQYSPLPPESRRTMRFDLALGKAYALAGKNDDALPPLRAVSNACIRLGSPIEQTRALYFLGLALENKGDLDGARKAYQTVVDRWGNAKPKSRTAEDAKKRLKQLE